MPSAFPIDADSFAEIPTGARRSDLIGGRTHRQHHNDLGDAVEAIQSFLLNGGGSSSLGTSVVQYGVPIDGATDASPSLQAAIDATPSGGALFFPAGTYLLMSRVFITKPITLCGPGAELVTIKFDPNINAGAGGMLVVGKDSGGTEIAAWPFFCRDLCFDGQNNTYGSHIINMATPTGARFDRCTFKNMKTRGAIRADWWTDVVSGRGNITVDSCKFLAGDSAGALNFYCNNANKGIENIHVTNNILDDVGNSVLLIGNTDPDQGVDGRIRQGSFIKTIVYNNKFTCNSTGPSGAIPLELWGHADSHVVGNWMKGGTRGIGVAWATRCLVAANICYDQTSYFSEIASASYVSYLGNSAYNCNTFVNDTGSGSDHVTIEGNTISGTSLSSYTPSSRCIKTNGPGVGLAPQYWTVKNNHIENYDFGHAVISLFGGSDHVISGNTYTVSSANAALQFVAAYGNNVLVEGNTIKIFADVATPLTAGIFGFVSGGEDISFVGNRVFKYGEITGFGAIAIGISSAPISCPRLSLVGNMVVGDFTAGFNAVANIPVNDGDTIFRDNDFKSATGDITLNAAIQQINNQILNVKESPFFAQGDGVADDQAAIAAAITACPTGGKVYFPAGTYLVGTAILIGKNITLIGESKDASTIKCLVSNPGSGNGFIVVSAGYATAFDDLTIDLNGTSNNLAGISATNTPAITMRSVNVINGGTRALALLNYTTTGCGNAVIDSCYFGSSGGSGISVFSVNAATPVDNIRISNCRFNALTGQSLYFTNTGGTPTYTFTNCRITGNRLTNGTGTAIGIEFDYASNSIVYDNYVADMLKGVSANLSSSLTIAENQFVSIDGGAVYLYSCSNVIISENNFSLCYGMVEDLSTTVGSNDVLISDNIYDGSGLSAYDSTKSCIKTASGMVNSGWAIRGNKIKDYVNGNTVITLRGASGSARNIIENNQYSATVETATFQFIAVSRTALVRDNTADITANWSSSNPHFADTVSVVVAHVPTTETVAVIFDQNTIRFSGSGASNVMAFGANAGAHASTGLQYVKNRAVGAFYYIFNMNVSTGDTIVKDNDVSLATGSNSYNAAIIFKNIVRQFSGTAAPASGAWLRGDIVWNETPSAAGVPGWVCTTAGSPGTWRSMAALS